MRLLERLASEHGVRAYDGITIDVPLRHADIASLIGSTRETVTSQMSELVREGRIRMAGRKIVLTAEASAAR
jgi:CRP/FNR family transcriptional regulator